MKSITHAEEFLRRSQQELHSSLNSLKLEYVAAVRRFAEAARVKRFTALREAIKDLEPQLESELWSEIDGMHLNTEAYNFLISPSGDLEAQSTDIRRVAFQHIRSVIKVTSTRYTPQAAFRAIEIKLARSWLGSTTPATSDSESEIGDDIEGAVRKSINELGFMLRAPITVLATVPFIFGLPIWPWMIQSRSYHLAMDVIYDRYKDEIVDPWIRSLNEEGEKSLIGTIEISSKVAKDLVVSALEREDSRYKRELEGKSKPVDAGRLQHLAATYGNFVAAEEALRQLTVCAKHLSGDATVVSTLSGA